MIWMWCIGFAGAGMILVIVGVLVAVLGSSKKARCGYKSTAVICDAKRYAAVGNNLRPTYHAVYEYEYQGNTYQNESTVGCSIMPKIGKTVTVYINPDNPKEYYIKSSAKTFVCVLLIGLGVFWIGLALLLFLISVL